MSRRHIALAALAAAAAAGAAWFPIDAGADAPVATAWWHVVRQTTPVGALPAAPVPDDGSLPVQNGPAGVLAYSAVRYSVGSATSGTLTLTLATPAPPVAQTVELCPARTPWTAGPDQEWDTRAGYDCRTHVAGTVTGATVRWQVSDTVIRDGELDAVLVPDASDPTPYTVSFARPGAASFVAAPGVQGPAPFTPPAAGAVAAPPAAAAAPAAVAGVPDAGVAAAPPAAAAAPVVAPPAAGAPAAPATTPAAARPLGSRGLAAGLLAGLAVALLLRGLGLGAARARPGRSLLLRTTTPPVG